MREAQIYKFFKETLKSRNKYTESGGLPSLNCGSLLPLGGGVCNNFTAGPISRPIIGIYRQLDCQVIQSYESCSLQINYYRRTLLTITLHFSVGHVYNDKASINFV